MHAENPFPTYNAVILESINEGTLIKVQKCNSFKPMQLTGK